MPTITFTKDFDFSPAALKGHSTIAYKKGMTKLVTTECADAAKKAGAAHPARSARNERRG